MMPSATGSPSTCGSPSGLGASTITIPGRNIAEEVIAYAEANNITQIVIGKSDHGRRWFEILHGSVVHELVRKAGSISVHVISAEESEPVPPEIGGDTAPSRTFPHAALRRQRPPRWGWLSALGC